jgi:hypothetical protein
MGCGPSAPQDDQGYSYMLFGACSKIVALLGSRYKHAPSADTLEVEA